MITDTVSTHPMVSIIIPAYNRAHLIGETIRSVITQTFGDWELIIVDDGSTDDTTAVVEQFNDARIQYFYTAHTGGFGSVRNYGIRRAKGAFIAFLDSDDLWLPHKLEEQLRHFEAEREAAFVFTHIELFGDTTVTLPDYKTLASTKLLSRYLEEGHFSFYPSSLIFRTSALDRTGYMNEALPMGADTDFFLNLCCHFRGSFLGERLVKIRKHPRNTSASDILFSYPETLGLISGLYRKKFVTRTLYRAATSKLYYKMGLLLKENKQYHEALRCFLHYFRIRPWHWKGWVRLAQVPFDYMKALVQHE